MLEVIIIGDGRLRNGGVRPVGIMPGFLLFLIRLDRTSREGTLLFGHLSLWFVNFEGIWKWRYLFH